MSALRRIIWLASFPKSGNTWLRSLLANYFQPPGTTVPINQLGQFTLSDTRQHFFDQAVGMPFQAQTVDAWIAARPKALELIAASKPGHHFVKTHCQPGRVKGVDLIPPDITAAAIYVMRNPFDVAPSYARHMNVSVDAVIDRMTDAMATHGSSHGIMEITGRWDDHVRNWTDATPGLPKHVLRYEDMLDRAEEVFGGLFTFLHLPIDRRRLGTLLESSSFSSLQRAEARDGFRERPPHMGQFFATGGAGGWREALEPRQAARLREAFLPLLERWYPEMLDATGAFAERAEA
ncbi:MAG: sulfotransferase domain-containing protein [Paracoccaceae bacterium]|nr:sulfotransferase domain-containing protein [Paracoccaceae bacterium]